MRPTAWIFNIFLFVLLLGKAFTQESQSDVDKSRQLLRNQMELKLRDYEFQAGESDDDSIGAQILVKRKPKLWNVYLSSDIGEIWSSNVFLTENDPVPDFAITHNDSVSASCKLTDQLTMTASFRHSIFRYNRLILQNFNAYNAAITYNYLLPYDINLYTGTQWTTIYSTPTRDSVYEEGDWNAGVSKMFPLNFMDWMKDKTAIFVGYQTDVRRASPKELDKFEVSPYVGFYYLIDPKIVSQVFYRWNYQHYQIYSRKDYNNSITGNITWSPYDWASLSAFCGYTDNNSLGKGSRNYSVFNTGATVKFGWKF